ncbi:HAD domain-containing protein [Ralstonia sp. 22111]|uniref:HAD domain-containing protein n=1 Tax=Ralstonia sp. 22111 TaxID=3453878 RepID=UPI003F873811
MAHELPKLARNPLTRDLQALGEAVRSRRRDCVLRIDDTAHACGVSADTLSRLENGKPVLTGGLLKVLEGLGLAMMILPRAEADAALRALGHTVIWHPYSTTADEAQKNTSRPAQELRSTTPTLFVDFDGTLHVGHALLDTTTGEVTLDTGRPLLEFAPLLVEMLKPYPEVEIVLTTSWLETLTLDQIISYLPEELARRVVGTTYGIKPRLGYVLDGSERTYVITSYAYGKSLKNWLAIDDSVRGAHQFGREPGELVDHFLLLDPARGINDADAQRRIRDWLASIHRNGRV